MGLPLGWDPLCSSQKEHPFPCAALYSFANLEKSGLTSSSLTSPLRQEVFACMGSSDFNLGESSFQPKQQHAGWGACH